jgi:hydroxymethylpyrimidine/phosphomethylpyrimidine kinase
MRRVLIIAGTDSSGGAGLTRDTGVAAAHGVQVAPVVTAVTAQTDHGVSAIHPVPPDLVHEQIRCALAAPVDAVKIGMLGSAETACAIADALNGTRCPVVMDPVLRTSSGHALSTSDSFSLIAPLIERITLLTPNLQEARVLADLPDGRPDALAAALGSRGVRASLIKGGHDTGEACVDLLHMVGAEQHRFSLPRLGRGRRGTGCALATAIACRLAGGHALPQACALAKRDIHRWIETGVFSVCAPEPTPDHRSG